MRRPRPAVALFEGMVEVATTGRIRTEAVVYQQLASLGLARELVQKPETGQTIRFRGWKSVRPRCAWEPHGGRDVFLETTIDGAAQIVLELVEEGDGTHQFREK